MTNIALITGATSGFGKAIAERFAAERWNLILTGRRKDRLDALEQRLREEFGIAVITLNFDVRSLEECTTHLAQLSIDGAPFDAQLREVCGYILQANAHRNST